jgi:hypothetical protein
MSARKPKLPSEAQAKEMAQLWSSWRKTFAHSPGVSKTRDVLVRNGWAEPTGEQSRFPNGNTAPLYRLSDAGLEALAGYFAAMVSARRGAA